MSRAGGSEPAPAAPPPERTYCLSTDFTISNSLDKTEYEYREDVPLHLQVSYRGRGPCYIRVGEGHDHGFLVGSVSEDGSYWSDPPCSTGRPADTITIEWAPGQTRTWDIVWHQEVLHSNETCDRYRQADAGEYDYVASLNGFKDLPEHLHSVQSPKIRFRIRPDPNPSPSPSGPIPL